MSKLYMIRQENGDSTIVQASNEQEALSYAGIGINVDELAQLNNLENSPELHVELALSGIGPQRYSIREIHNLHIHIRLTDEGQLEYSADTDSFMEEIDTEYPYLVEAAEQIGTDPIEARLDNPAAKTIWEKAAKKERNRLFRAGLGLSETGQDEV